MPLSSKRYDFIFHLAAYDHVGNSLIHMSEALGQKAMEQRTKEMITLFENMLNGDF